MGMKVDSTVLILSHHAEFLLTFGLRVARQQRTYYSRQSAVDESGGRGADRERGEAIVKKSLGCDRHVVTGGRRSD